METVTINITESTQAVTANITEEVVNVQVTVTDPNMIDEITFGPTAPANPSLNKLWIQTP
jgi:hypothetical protein